MSRNKTKICGGLLIACAAGFLIWLFVRQHAVENRSYRIGWENDPPEQLPGEHEEPTGFAVELVSQAARRRGIRLEWVYRNESSEAALRGGHVDLWPVMTITPERKGVVHISAAYLQSAHCFLVRADSGARQLRDLSTGRIGYSGVPINRIYLARYLPTAQFVAQPQGELIRSICRREIDGAFLEEHSAIATLLGGGGCTGQALSIIPTQGPRLLLGVGATFKAAAAADALRDEIGNMAAEGRLSALLAKWGYLTGRSEESIQALLNARRRERRLVAIAGAIALLLMLTVLQTGRVTRERNRAKRSQQDLRESERRFRELFENVRLIGLMTDHQGNITFANRFALDVSGWTSQELLGRNQFQFHPPEYHERVAEALAKAYGANGTGAFVEAPVCTKDGKTLWIQWHATTLRGAAGNAIGLAILGVDLTEHRALREQYLQVQKMESIGRLAGGVAHDFNNLLTVINGYSDLVLARLGATNPLLADVEQIRSAGERAAGLTRQLLAFSRKQVTHPKPVDLNCW